MADNNMADNSSGDILGQLLSNVQTVSDSADRFVNDKFVTFSDNVEKHLEQIERAVLGMSQSGASDRVFGRDRNTGREFRNRDKDRRGVPFGTMGSRSTFRRDDVKLSQGFFDNFENEILKGFLGSDFRNDFANMFTEVERKIGISMKDVPGIIGKNMAASFMKGFKSTQGGQDFIQSIENIKSKATEGMANFLSGLVDFRSYGLDNSDFAGGIFSNLSQESAVSASEHTVNPNSSEFDAESSAQDVVNAVSRNLGDISCNNLIVNQISDIGSNIAANVEESVSQFSDLAHDELSDAADSFSEIAQEGLSVAANKFEDVAKRAASQSVSSMGVKFAQGSQGLLGQLGVGISTFTSGISGMLGTVSSIVGKGLGMLFSLGGPWMALIMLAGKLLVKAFEPATEGFKKLLKGMTQAANREKESRKKNLEEQKKRLSADIKAMVEYPFEILRRAAEELQENWSANISKINQTQGYTKDDLMSLMSSLTARLRDEGLTDVIAGTDIVDALSRVLDSGLSGPIAEEFAYQASKLGKAIPTQDFFDFAKSYASVAANAVKDGKSQSEAIAKANEELYSFTSNLLYANRELTGGFTTGLKDATDLYEKATKIAQAARSDNASEISGVLTAVAGVTGAIAPDLASALTDTLYKLATGGNSEDVVALRSIAGINASNTDFLRAFATSPQQIITRMFNNLGNMFNQSSDAYMEKAEGYASLFGLSAEAFQRIDFSYLAQQIANMNTNNNAIDENLALLASGQSTATKEQLKIAEINQLMIDEGLAYVIDNEFAQMVQQHMWDEQIARQMTESMYAVELQGSALEFLEGIKNTVQNILNFLNPFAWIKKLVNLVATANEEVSQRADIEAILEAGKVGNGTAKELMQLTTTNRNLDLIPQLAEMMTGYSAYGSARRTTEFAQALTSPFLAIADEAGNIIQDVKAYAQHAIAINLYSQQSGSGVASRYSWGGLTSKEDATSVANLLALTSPAALRASAAATEAADATERSASSLAGRVEEMILSIDQYIADHRSYEDWKLSASEYGISDFEKAAESLGYTEQQLQYYFQDKETQAGVEEKHNNEMSQWVFYRRALEFFGGQGDRKFWEDFNDPLVTNMLAVQSKQDEILDAITEYTSMYAESNKAWESHWREYANYYLYHQIYSGSSLNLIKLRQVQRAEKDEEGDLMTALSKYLSDNDWNLEDFKDPQIQANALLSKILIVLTAIMNQNNEKVGSVSFADSLSALAMGMTTNISV